MPLTLTANACVDRSTMRIDQLETLCALVVTGSVTAAAEHLGISQPTATRRLQRLESDLGLLLIRAEHRAVTLTPAGELVAKTAAQVVGLISTLHDELVTDTSPPLRGRLRIAASTIPGEHLVPQLVAGFAAAHPNVSIEVEIASSGTVFRRLQAGEAEVGFMGAMPPSTEWTAYPIATDEIVLVVPPDHAFADQSQVTADRLHGQEFIVREAGSATQATVDRALASIDGSPPRMGARLAVGSTQAVLATVRAGGGIGFASSRAVEQAGRSVRGVRIVGATITRELHLVYEAERLRLPLQDRFLSWVRGSLTTEE